MDLDYKKKEAKEIIRLLYRQFYSGSDRNASEMYHLVYQKPP